MNEGAVTERKSVIDEELGLLSARLDEAADISHSLVTQLSPVMRPSVPELPGADASAKLAEEPSPIVLRIRQLVGRVDSICREEKQALQRLQL